MRRFRHGPDDPHREIPDRDPDDTREPDDDGEVSAPRRFARAADADPPPRIAARTGPKGLRALADTLPAITGPLLGKHGFAGSRVVADWPSIVGEALAARSLPERVTYPPGGRGPGTLSVRIASGGLALELQHLEPLIIERINTYFGRPAVARLRFVHAPLPELREPRVTASPPSPEAGRAAAALAANIENPRLRKALGDLGAHLLKDR